MKRENSSTPQPAQSRLSRREFLAGSAGALGLIAAGNTLASAEAAAPANDRPDDAVRDIASRLELFVDRYLIDRTQGVALRLHRPVDAGVALKFDRPWEGQYCAYCTV